MNARDYASTVRDRESTRRVFAALLRERLVAKIRHRLADVAIWNAVKGFLRARPGDPA